MSQPTRFNRKVLSAAFLGAVFTALSACAWAQFVGQGVPAPVPEGLFTNRQEKPGYAGPSTAQPFRTVAEVLKNPVDDQPVILRGKLTKKLRKEHYEFSDGTGSVRVEIDDEDFVKQPVNENTLVELQGEIEKEFMESPEIDVDRMSVVLQ